MKKLLFFGFLFCGMLVFSYQSNAKTNAYKDSTHGFSLEIPAGWQKEKDSIRPHYVTFYGPRDKSGSIPTFVITVIDKQADFIAFVDAVIKESQEKTKDYFVIKKTCTEKIRCEALATYSFDPKSIMLDTKNKKNGIGVDKLKTRQIFLNGKNKFYILSAVSLGLRFNQYEKDFKILLDSFKENTGFLDKYF